VVYIKVLWAFVITFKYYLLTYIKPISQINELKQKWASDVLKHLGYDLKTHGSLKINDLNQPHIFVGNHISFLDILVVMASHPRTVFLSKKELKSWPIIGAGAVRAGTLFVDRNSKHDRNKSRQEIGQQLLDHKAHLVVFPSGTTTLDENILWKKGIFEIAKFYQIPIQTFKIIYQPMRESAYIDEDSLLGQMRKQIQIKNKKVDLHWLSLSTVSEPEITAENIRLEVVNHLTS